MARAPRLLLSALAGALLVLGPGTAMGGGEGLGFRLSRASVSPQHPLFAGKRKIRLRYAFDANRPVDLRASVVRARSGEVVRRWHERAAQPGQRLVRAWDGLDERGRSAPDGGYEFRIGPAGGEERFAARLKLHGHAFPVAGPHGTRGPIGEFGAPRNGGRVHEGFDVTGDCGTPLIAARGGVVERVAYDPLLYGNYVLIDAAKSEQDYFYAHMVAPSEVGEGERVYTGQELGEIGQTGDAAATPCHLHFEIRVGGVPIDPEPALRRWDAYS